MNDAERRALLQVLGNAMSDISEDCYCAGWMGGAEYFVPELCRRALDTNQSQNWGHGEVTQEQARGLLALAELVGSWADLDDDATGYIPFQPFPIPPQFMEAIEREQKLSSTQSSGA